MVCSNPKAIVPDGPKHEAGSANDREIEHTGFQHHNSCSFRLRHSLRIHGLIAGGWLGLRFGFATGLRSDGSGFFSMTRKMCEMGPDAAMIDPHPMRFAMKDSPNPAVALLNVLI